MFIPERRFASCFCVVVLTLVAASRAHAQPDAADSSRPDTVLLSEEDRSPAPPAPVLMPELVPRSRLTISPMASSALFINILQLGVTGTFAVDRLELFGELRARLAHVLCIDCRGDDGQGFALGNLRAGARYHLGTGRFRVAPSVWGWLPSSNATAESSRRYLQMLGVDDWRAYGPGVAALGIAVDLGWYGDAEFVQAELGAALVSDDGPQIDNVFGAVGYGKHVSPRTSFLTEWRVDMFPNGERLHGPALGFGRGDGAASGWRMRFHPYVFEDFEWAGIAVALDFRRRF